MSDGERRRVRFGERGSATVLTAMAVTVLCAVFAAALALGQAVAARHRAAAAADLAALAAADRALHGPSAACASAVRTARAQGAAVVSCTVRGEVAEVTARARFGPYAPAVRARAGPAAPTSPSALTGPAAPGGAVLPGGRAAAVP
ncbi:Rv3654c family TadE-like protein [Streptomyces sp. PR69]|uniref:Rv3654c family TadE-like protein n=1 Tax=Streptomyces sp. PR69 TaxID=2984950 RepID=UPI0022649715|nr:Rv3654c family TadE-like protein [Streptomyces sp. PR69]